jgi:hypothetical protein
MTKSSIKLEDKPFHQQTELAFNEKIAKYHILSVEFYDANT